MQENPPTDRELIDRADAGLRGQGAVVEMMARLREAVTRLDQTSSTQQEKMLRLTRWITILTWVMATTSIIQIGSILWQICRRQ